MTLHVDARDGGQRGSGALRLLLRGAGAPERGRESDGSQEERREEAKRERKARGAPAGRPAGTTARRAGPSERRAASARPPSPVLPCVESSSHLLQSRPQRGRPF